MTITDRWILSRLIDTANDVRLFLEQFRYSQPLTRLYRFFWNDFCDWYLEWAKLQMKDAQQKPTTQNVLAFVLDQTLRLLHPFVPFITEGIFQKLNEIAPARKMGDLAEASKAEALVVAQWPDDERLLYLQDPDIEDQIETIQKPIRAIRDIKNKYNISHTKRPATSATTTVQIATILNENSGMICNLAGVKKFKAGPEIVKPKSAATAIVDDIQVYVHDVIDVGAERQRLEKQKEQIEKARKGVEAKLANEDFLNKAKPRVVAQAREKLAQLQEQLKTVEKNLSQLQS